SGTAETSGVDGLGRNHLSVLFNIHLLRFPRHGSVDDETRFEKPDRPVEQHPLHRAVHHRPDLSNSIPQRVQRREHFRPHATVTPLTTESLLIDLGIWTALFLMTAWLLDRRTEV